MKLNFGGKMVETGRVMAVGRYEYDVPGIRHRHSVVLFMLDGRMLERLFFAPDPCNEIYERFAQYVHTIK